MPAELFQQARDHHLAGQLFHAESEYRNLLFLHPGHVPAMVALGALLDGMGRQEAVRVYTDVLAIEPDHIDALLKLGSIFQRTGALEAASRAFERALQVTPRHAALHLNYGIVLHGMGRVDAAMAAFEAAGRHDPGLTAAFSNLGILLAGQGRQSEAEQAFRAAIAADDRHVLSYCGLGLSLHAQARTEDALDAFAHAIAIDDADPATHLNFGKTLVDLNRHEEAREAFRRAVAIDPDLAAAHYGIGQTSLTLGDFREGWSEFQWRHQPELRLPGPLWQGEPLHGRSILVYHEQGYGDCIQLARYCPLLIAAGARVFLGAQKPLVQLFGSIEGAEVIDWDRLPLPDYDVRVPMMSLPGFFDTGPTTIPASTNLFRIDTDELDRWAKKLVGPNPRIGIQWAGNPQNIADRARSAPLSELLPLLAVEGIDWVILQKGANDDEKALLRDLPTPVIDLGDSFESFYDTAAAIMALDAVVSVDTAICHLAGSLGVPVWLMLAFSADWRWMLNREDSPWYPSMRLFRQPRPGDWPSVVQRVAVEAGRLAVARAQENRASG